MTLNCIHIFIFTGSFLYWCVMRPASQRFFIHSCIYLRILIISYLATFIGTNSQSVLMYRKAINQSINQSIKTCIGIHRVVWQVIFISRTWQWMICATANCTSATSTIHTLTWHTVEATPDCILHQVRENSCGREGRSMILWILYMLGI